MWPPGTPATAALRAELIGPGSNHSALEWITAATQALSMSIAIAAMVIVVTHPSDVHGRHGCRRVGSTKMGRIWLTGLGLLVRQLCSMGFVAGGPLYSRIIDADRGLAPRNHNRGGTDPGAHDDGIPGRTRARPARDYDEQPGQRRQHCRSAVNARFCRLVEPAMVRWPGFLNESGELGGPDERRVHGLPREQAPFNDSQTSLSHEGLECCLREVLLTLHTHGAPPAEESHNAGQRLQR